MAPVKGKASSYGDTKDQLAYQRALIAHLRSGASQARAEALARKVGDPGIGWSDNTLSDLTVPWVALRYEDWQERWGSKGKAHKKKVLVTINGKTVTCYLGDTMPHKSEMKTKAVVDLAPGAQAAFGLKAPFLVDAEWTWGE